MTRLVVFRFVTLLVALLLTTTGPAHADDPNRAGVVVQHGDGTIQTACVEFEEPTISGFELLRRSGLEITYDTSGGTMICAIEGEGCRFPSENCFCQCQGDGACVYWSYWHLDSESGEWSYSQRGAAAYQVAPGSVDGWRWGAGTPGDTERPQALTFAEICAPEPTVTTTAVESTAMAAPSATVTAVLTETPGATPTVEASTPSQSTPTPTPTSARAVPTATPFDDAPAQAENETGLPREYAVFGLLVLVLLGGLVWMQRQ